MKNPAKLNIILYNITYNHRKPETLTNKRLSVSLTGKINCCTQYNALQIYTRYSSGPS